MKLFMLSYTVFLLGMSFGVTTIHAFGLSSGHRSASAAVKKSLTNMPPKAFPSACCCSKTATTTTGPHSTTTSISMSWNSGDGGGYSFKGTDRILSCIPYLLPLLDGDAYGKYIYARIPILGFLDNIVLGPFEAIFNGIPFLQLGVFFALVFGSRNADLFSRDVRFNMQQAILIDILLIFCGLVGQIAGFGAPRFLAEPANNFVFYTMIAMIGYSIYSNIVGKKPDQIPIVSEAAEMQLGPF